MVILTMNLIKKKIHRLLVETEEFNRLKEQLASPPEQQTPALITPDGLLVNGNTRCLCSKRIRERG